MSEGIRLQVYMARCGVGSRRACEQYIRDGRVAVNGVRASLGSKVQEADRVALDDRPLRLQGRMVYLAVNKPRGYLCSNSDSRGRPLVLDLLGELPVRIYHVGRLDFQSSGLIFYTNDGNFTKLVSHPSSGIEKEYVVEAKIAIPEELLQKYRRGLSIQGERYRSKRYLYKTPRKVLITLEEGKNREIRRVFQHFRVSLGRIHRVRIGCVALGGLSEGAYRNLTVKEVSWFLGAGRGKNDRSD